MVLLDSVWNFRSAKVTDRDAPHIFPLSIELLSFERLAGRQRIKKNDNTYGQ